MVNINLPKPFGRLLNKYAGVLFFGQPYTIIEAYVDHHYPLKDGVQSLRQYLGLDDNDTCCDLFCVLEVAGEKKHLLWEDKGQRGKGTHPQHGKKQLEYTYKKLKSKHPGLVMDHVILSNIKLHRRVLLAPFSKEQGTKVLTGPNNQAIKCLDKPIQVLEG